MGKGASGASPSVTSGLQGDADALTQIAMGQANNANQLFQSSLPGFNQATSYYSALASGDPAAIARAIAPIATQADTARGAEPAPVAGNATPCRAGATATIAVANRVNRGSLGYARDDKGEGGCNL